ncbi:hypothetical protein M5D96_007416 [Drosophila gunungcola]|uniref:Spondin-1 n=1 Tax=Drosophila gunungcola TaxID=103775 RepID=A0A9P9YN67_9MUSC|nr:hypothetical protein M5D96_007416 [Drosophila gunungcola]
MGQSLPLLIRLVVVVWLTISTATACPRAPTHLNHGRRTRGDNGYKLIVADGPNGYVPGKTYNQSFMPSIMPESPLLLLLFPADWAYSSSDRSSSKLYTFCSLHFTHFTIAAEAHTGARRPQAASPRRVGRFQLFSDSLTKFNDRCVNTVSEADSYPKTEVQVMWVAPEAGSGCVSLSAMVYEGPKAWFADDGNLSTGIWSNETHPKDYPFAIWLTHFSDVIGASHEANFSFWGENHIATAGFRSLAEWGSPTALEGELRANGPKLRTLIKAAGLWYPNVNQNTSAKFRVDRKHPKVSLVSMFGPSPDWVVGISGLDLCTEDCSWKESMTFDLYPWDAGTDSGISYMSPNSETQPPERMYRITTMYPEDPRAPFYNPQSREMPPLARLHLRREKIISRNCDDDFLKALQLEVSDDAEEQDTRAECRVSDYSAWSACSVSCGKGIRMRNRQYLYPAAADQSKCSRQLVSKEMCVASIPECAGGDAASSQPRDRGDDEGEDLANSQSLVGSNGEGAGLCKTTPWTVWSECSASCGIGITMRTRSFVNYLGRKRCPHISVVEKNKCMRPDCTYEQVELPDPQCPTTQWSDWSPCIATCGKGVTIRTRLVLLENGADKENCTRRMELHQQKECDGPTDCHINAEQAKDICVQAPDAGPCRGNYMRYAYDPQSQRCGSFVYGGCRGNRNNFLTENDCLNTCNVVRGSAPSRSDRRRNGP